jgi:hypothetical protein
MLGAVGWVSGLSNVFPREGNALFRLASAGRWDEAQALYRWFMPLLHLDTHLAARFGDGSLDPAQLASLDDSAVTSQLRNIPGIGPWSVDMVLIFGLGRPDILPVGDYGLRMGVKEQFGLAAPPGPAELEELAQPWRPSAPRCTPTSGGVWTSSTNEKS